MVQRGRREDPNGRTDGREIEGGRREKGRRGHWSGKEQKEVEMEKEARGQNILERVGAPLKSLWAPSGKPTVRASQLAVRESLRRVRNTLSALMQEWADVCVCVCGGRSGIP